VRPFNHYGPALPRESGVRQAVITLVNGLGLVLSLLRSLEALLTAKHDADRNVGYETKIGTIQTVEVLRRMVLLTSISPIVFYTSLWVIHITMMVKCLVLNGYGGKCPSLPSSMSGSEEICNNEIVLHARIGCAMNRAQIMPDKSGRVLETVPLSAHMYIETSIHAVLLRL